ncbi:hypothetical protein [Pelagicoccus mobilis]|uniref:Uncharacterized protein n=1 Tax=Pelagicoccus mobilis TaxID=415221 RepID=A0A934RYM5_9BACT|nr:hypothetical protein [Pelagicoccus mobilis]MBK1877905.1 hypothetical protein [Pelagicoccus mobilis]
MKAFVFSVLIQFFVPSVFSSEEKVYSRIVADFNEDGIIDVAYSEPGLCGNAGCWWSIHKGRGNGFYEKEVLSAFFHPLAVNISMKEGKPVVTIYHRAGGGEGQLIEYEPNSNELTKISERTIYPDDNGNAKDRLLYEELFGDLRNNRIDETISEVEYLEQIEKIRANQAIGQ